MDSINSITTSGPEMHTLKKAIDLQGQELMQVLESAQAPAEQQSSASLITGIGQTLDLRA